MCRNILVFAFVYIFVAENIQVKGGFSPSSAAKARRTQSMKTLPSHGIEFIPEMEVRSGSISSTASDSSMNTRIGADSQTIELSSSLASDSFANKHKTVDSQPIESTSSVVRSSSLSLAEVESQPLVKKSNRVKINDNPVNLNDASTMTHTNGRINPVRDGVFARARNSVLRNVPSAGVGFVAGVGIARSVASKQLFQGDNNTQMNDTDIQTSASGNETSSIYDGIINYLSKH